MEVQPVVPLAPFEDEDRLFVAPGEDARSEAFEPSLKLRNGGGVSDRRPST